MYARVPEEMCLILETSYCSECEVSRQLNVEGVVGATRLRATGYECYAATGYADLISK